MCQRQDALLLQACHGVARFISYNICNHEQSEYSVLLAKIAKEGNTLALAREL
jgi:hypothetical protein